jgi:hypothetical protein
MHSHMNVNLISSICNIYILMTEFQRADSDPCNSRTVQVTRLPRGLIAICQNQSQRSQQL